MNVATVELTDRSRYGMAMPTSDERLREAMLYVAQALESDHGGRGAVKLNKVLWWADFESFRERHRSVTGAMYQKLPEGPAPVRLRPARDALLADGDAELRERDVGAPRREAILHALRAPAPVFDADDLRFLDMAAERFRGMSGRECSDFSHQASVGWRAVEMEQVIPYETSIIDPRPLTDADRAWGISIAARAGLTPE